MKKWYYFIVQDENHVEILLWMCHIADIQFNVTKVDKGIWDIAFFVTYLNYLRITKVINLLEPKN